MTPAHHHADLVVHPLDKAKGDRPMPLDTTTTTPEALVLETLRADEPMTVAAIIKAVHDRTNMRLPRPTVYGVLDRLLAKSLAAYIEDEAGPRRWFAIPPA